MLRLILLTLLLSLFIGSFASARCCGYGSVLCVIAMALPPVMFSWCVLTFEHSNINFFFLRFIALTHPLHARLYFDVGFRPQDHCIYQTNTCRGPFLPSAPCSFHTVLQLFFFPRLPNILRSSMLCKHAYSKDCERCWQSISQKPLYNDKKRFRFLVILLYSLSRMFIHINIYARLHTFTHRHARLSSHLNTRARTRMLSLIPSPFLYISHMKVMEELLGLRARLVDCLICRFQVSGWAVILVFLNAFWFCPMNLQLNVYFSFA